MTLRDCWWFLCGSALTWALASGVAKTSAPLDVAVFVGIGVLCALVPLRGWFGTAPEDMEDATASFRRARMAIREERQ